MLRSGWILAAVSLLLTQGASAGAGSLEVRVEPGRVALQADEVPLGQILKALTGRAGIHVVVDERRVAQPVTVRLEAGGIQEAIVRLMREAGGGNYAIFSSNSQGKVETFAFQEGGGAPPAPQATPAAPPASAGPPAYAGGDGSTPYAPAPRNPDEKPVAPADPYGSIGSRSPGPAPAPPDADVDDGPASLNARDELAQEEYKRRLESTRSQLEKGAKKFEDVE